MKIAIVFESHSGNTKLLAEAIKDCIKPEDLLYFAGVEEGIEADFYFVGSWTQKGMCTPKIAEFLQSLKGQKIAFFGTAGYGGSVDYYKALVERIKSNLDSTNEFVDWFYCQGKMPQSVRDRYEKMITEHPEDKNLKVSLENFDAALTHPDEADLKAVKAWAEKIVSEL
ncbi:MAG: flavodoxin family protein [Eubacteriales bacterium]|nr:flavodoxin family protein [Eubacteriales bacterium]